MTNAASQQNFEKRDKMHLFFCLFVYLKKKKEKRKAAYLLDCKTLHQALLKAEAFRDNDHRTVKGVNELEVYKYCSLLCYKYFTRFLSFLTCKEELE